MKLIEFINRMKDMDSIFGIIGVAILGLFLLFIIFKMLGGMRRGTWRQLVRTLATLAAAIASVIFGVIVSNKIIGSLESNKIEALLLEIDARMPEIGEMIRNALNSIDTEIIEYIILLPATIIIVPIMTTVIFLVVNLVFKIIRAILVKVLKFKKAKNNTQRLGGALLAAVEFIIWTTMVLFPITGIITLVDAAYLEAMNSTSQGENTALTETYDDYLRPFTENPTFTFVENVGGNMISRSIATVKINGEKTDMREEILSVAHTIIVDFGELRDADFTALNEEQQTALTNITDTLAQSPFMSNILVSVFNTIPAVYDSGLIPLDFGEDFGEVLDSFMSFLSQVDRDTLGDDLHTLEDFYFGFCDSGLLTALENNQDIMDFVSEDYRGDRHLLGMVNSLSGNPRTKGIVDSLYNMVLQAAFSNSGSDDSADGEGGANEPLPEINISDVKDGLNEIVSVKKENYDTEEEYREVLSDTISTTINDTIGVELEQETADEIADYVDENFSEQIGDLTDEEFNELIFEVIDIYQGYLNGEEINPDDLENLLPGGGEVNPDDLFPGEGE